MANTVSPSVRWPPEPDSGPKRGFTSHEVTDRQLREAEIIVLSLHWYLPMAALLEFLDASGALTRARR